MLFHQSFIKLFLNKGSSGNKGKLNINTSEKFSVVRSSKSISTVSLKLNYSSEEISEEISVNELEGP